VFDPWNGSGTTTYSASLLGLRSYGFDLNPVMIVVARARLLPITEADNIEPLAKEVVKFAEPDGEAPLDADEPLSLWFSERTSVSIRAIERSIRERLVGAVAATTVGPNLEWISELAATFYVALFSVCRELASPFLSSNPTWLRRPKDGEPKVNVPRDLVEERLVTNLRSMALALADRGDLLSDEWGVSEVRLSDTTSTTLPSASVDLILTSPPYCTRIDYTAATRIELAVLSPLAQVMPDELGRKMIGSIRVPKQEIDVDPSWGQRCRDFLEALRRHPSKASAGYYYKTHLDYFDKIARSISNASQSLKTNGRAIFVVQDSYYKEIHNDLPSIITEIGEAHGLRKHRHENFRLSRSMSGINPNTRLYRKSIGSIEAVLCFSKG
jgi:hypothetical protein